MTEVLAALSSEGTLLADQLSVELTVEDGQAGRWFGSFRVGPKVPLKIDATCTLAFVDGRRGEIQITRLAYGGPNDPVRVHFRGTGKLA